MEQYVRPEDLPVINYELPSNKNRELEELINLLKWHNLDDDNKFNDNLNKLIKRIKLVPIKFKKPSIADHKKIIKSFPSSFNNLTGGHRKISVYTVRYKFTGSSEIFNYRPNKYSIGDKDLPCMFQPGEYGQFVDIIVEDIKIEHTKLIIKNANKQIRLTKKLIKINNKFIKQWSAGIEKEIEHKLTDHRDKLKKISK